MEDKKMKPTSHLLDHVRCSVLETRVYDRLAKEFGITPTDEVPSVSVPRARSGSNGHETLEFLVAADGSEHVRMSACNKDEWPYLILTGENPSVADYRFTVYVPSGALEEFIPKHSEQKDGSNPLHLHLASNIRNACERQEILWNKDAHFDVAVAQKELKYITAELIRAYLR